MKESALAYLAAGWHVIPVEYKRALIDWTEFQLTQPTPEQVNLWWNTWPNAGIAVILGSGSGLIRVDVDNATNALDSLGGVPCTAEFKSPNGHGYLLQWESWVSTAVLWTGKGSHEELRVQSEGAYTVIPPTPGYTWIRNTPIARSPRWLLSWYAEKALRETPSVTIRCDLKDTELQEALAHISADSYDIWLRVGMALHSHDSFELWDTWSQTSTKYKPGECERKWATFNGCGLTVATIIHYARQAGWKPTWSPYEPLTEGGNANVLARTAQGRALHSPELGWLAWDGCVWTSNKRAEGMVQEMQKDALRLRREGIWNSITRIRENGIEAEQKRRAKMKTLSKIDTLDRAPAFEGTRRLACSAMYIDWRLFNQKPTLLNARNGTIDLRTGNLLQHNSADMLMTVIPWEYDAKATCPEFESFLTRSLPDYETREYLRLKLGSTLLGHTRKEILILWGPDGDNGKTVMVELMQNALGEDYAVTCSRDLLSQRYFSDSDRQTVTLFGKRFASASETNEGARLDEARLKELTGGDKISTRKLYKEKFTFDPTHDIVYITNHKPVLIGTDNALWNRIKLVEFSQSFPPGHPERVEGLKDKLQVEMPGIVAWLVRACTEYLKVGLTDVTSKTVATYREENNPVAQFIEARGYTKTDGIFKIRKDRVVEAFKTWNSMNTKVPFNAQWFGRQMKKLGIADSGHYYFLSESSQ